MTVALLDQYGKAMPSREEREQMDAERQDAWANPQTGIGVWGQDKTKAATYLPVWRVLDQELTSLMNGNDIARKIVSKRPEEMFRRGFEIEGDDIDASDNDDMREFATEHLDLENNLREGKRWGRLYGGSLLLMGIDDGRMPWEPLDENNIRDFYSLSLVDRRYAYVQSQYSGMGVSSQYGKANVYLISNAVAGYGWESYGAQKITPKTSRELTQQGAQVALVHESRVLRFDGNPADIVTRQNLAGWSWSVLQVVYDAMKQFDGSFDSVAYLLSDASQGVFKLQGLIKAISSGNRASLAMRLQLLEMSRSVMHGIALDAGEKDGRPTEDFTRVPTPLGGIAEILDKMMARIACAADMPLTELFGRAPAGLNATGESDTRKWYDTIESEQKNELGPQIKRVFKLLGLAKKGPLRRKDPVQWKIKFKPLWSPSDTEQAQARLADAQRDEVYITQGCVKPEEVSLNLVEIYPNMNVQSREQALEGGVKFNPYENQPAPQSSALISGKTEGEPLSPKVPVPLMGTSGTQITAGNLPAAAAGDQATKEAGREPAPADKTTSNAATTASSHGAAGPDTSKPPAGSPAAEGMPKGGTTTPMQQGATKEAEAAKLKAGAPNGAGGGKAQRQGGPGRPGGRQAGGGQRGGWQRGPAGRAASGWASCCAGVGPRRARDAVRSGRARLGAGRGRPGQEAGQRRRAGARQHRDRSQGTNGQEGGQAGGLFHAAARQDEQRSRTATGRTRPSCARPSSARWITRCSSRTRSSGPTTSSTRPRVPRRAASSWPRAAVAAAQGAARAARCIRARCSAPPGAPRRWPRRSASTPTSRRRTSRRRPPTTRRPRPTGRRRMSSAASPRRPRILPRRRRTKPRPRSSRGTPRSTRATAPSTTRPP